MNWVGICRKINKFTLHSWHQEKFQRYQRRRKLRHCMDHESCHESLSTPTPWDSALLTAYSLPSLKFLSPESLWPSALPVASLSTFEFIIQQPSQSTFCHSEIKWNNIVSHAHAHIYEGFIAICLYLFIPLLYFKRNQGIKCIKLMCLVRT